ncbi:hypothetical protein B0H34DRAFT_471221 [Crassisporium funariophilum]|nr:hypothetical protein B0H34DRAFT_471221 [Crassisporium funariophilum]
MSFVQQNLPAASQDQAQFSSLGSDLTAVSRGPVEEHGFRAPFIDYATEARRGSYQSRSSAGFQSMPPTMPVPMLGYQPGLHPQSADYAHQTFSGVQGPQHMDQDHIQFATYRDDMFANSQKLSPPPFSPNHNDSRTWVPWPLRPYFWVPFVVLMFCGAIGLEVALFLSNKHQGWSSGDTDRASLILHYAYTLPPVMIASIFVAMWAWTDVEIKKIQPYVDLVHGDSPPHRSLLLDYTRYNNFLVWTRAANNKHYLVALASLMVVLSLSFQPLAAALLVVRDTWWQDPDMVLSNVAAIGLNQDSQFGDLTSFLTAAGFAGASVMYDLAPPAFINGPYTVAPFELPNTVKNGTAFANTTAVKSETGCVPVPVQMSQLSGGSWSNSVSYNGCSITFQVANNSSILFGTDTPACNDYSDPEFSPVIFWFFSYQPSARASATFCYPSFSLWEVNAGVDVVTGNLTKVVELRPFTQYSNFSSSSATVTGPPLNGRAYNGVKFNLTNADQFVLARQSATQLQLPAAVYQAAVKSPQGFIASFDNNAFSTLSNEVYGVYLSLIAREIYFVADNEPITIQVKSIRKRVFVSDVAAHLLTTAMLILAFFASIIHFFHREDRRNLRLKHEPGTIASAVAFGAQTGVGEVLAGRQAESDIKEALQNRKFRIDPVTMKIVMEGEYGYESATSPMTRRRSVFEILQGQRGSRVFPKSPSSSVPQSPKTPDPRVTAPTTMT